MKLISSECGNPRPIKDLVSCYIVFVALMMVSGCSSGSAGKPPEGHPMSYTEDREPCGDHNSLRNLYFGDLHAHSRLSYDACAWGSRASTAEVYAFAKGAELGLPPFDRDGNPSRTAKLSRPLDFVALTEHSEFLGETHLCTTPGSSAYDTFICRLYRNGGMLPVMIWSFRMAANPPLRFGAICGQTGLDCTEAAKEVWRAHVQDAEDAYDRSPTCSFTTFPAYEFTPVPNLTNFHRNIIFRNAKVPELPLSYFEKASATDLWPALKETCLDTDTGCDFIAIAHNSNWSNGNLFTPDYLEGRTMEEQEEAAAFRAKMEPLVEIIQHKGSMECKNGFDGIPDDPLCDFEKIRPTEFVDCEEDPGAGAMIGLGCVSRYDYIRNVLKLGLSEERRIGVNPYKLGFIGSTDTHNATPGKTEEYGFSGHMGITDDTLGDRLAPVFGAAYNTPTFNPGGLTAVWSEENSRDALFEAFRRREVYSTSGTRMRVRFFGGWDYPAGVCNDPDFVSVGYERGVPMGGDLTERPDETSTPEFAVMALKDPGVEHRPGTDLQRIQIIKGWIDVSGEANEKVFEVAGDPRNGAGVDPESCEPFGGGWEKLCALWRDPEFDPDLKAFYYARVVENPTCSWRQHDCNAYLQTNPVLPRSCSDASLRKVIQERAVTSPIWYDPGE